MDLVDVVLLVLQLRLQEIDLAQCRVQLLLLLQVLLPCLLFDLLRAQVELLHPGLLLLQVILRVLQLDVFVVQLVFQHLDFLL